MVCEGELHVARGRTLTWGDLAKTKPVDLDTLPARQRHRIEDAVASCARRVRVGDRTVAVEA